MARPPVCRSCPARRRSRRRGRARPRSPRGRSGSRCCSRPSAGGGGRACASCTTPDELGAAFRAGAGGGARGVRRRRRLPGEAIEPAPPHRDPGARRSARQRGPPGRARVLHPAAPPEDDRGGAVARSSTPSLRAAWARPRSRRRRRPVHNAGTFEFLLDPRRRVLLPGDEHPAAGRAPGDRAGHRDRSGAAAAPGRRGRAAAFQPGGRRARAATPSSAGSTPRIPFNPRFVHLGNVLRPPCVSPVWPWPSASTARLRTGWQVTPLYDSLPRQADRLGRGQERRHRQDAAGAGRVPGWRASRPRCRSTSASWRRPSSGRAGTPSSGWKGFLGIK